MRERNLIALIAVTLAALTGACRTLEANGVPEIIAGPYLQHVTQTSMTIMWETDQPCTSAVEFGQAERVGKNQATPLRSRIEENRKRTIHEVVLEGLKAQTNYFYRVNSANADGGKAESEIYSFQTAVHDDSPFAFVVVGDNRTYPERFAKVMARAWADARILWPMSVIWSATVT